MKKNNNFIKLILILILHLKNKITLIRDISRGKINIILKKQIITYLGIIFFLTRNLFSYFETICYTFLFGNLVID